MPGTFSYKIFQTITVHFLGRVRYCPAEKPETGLDFKRLKSG